MSQKGAGGQREAVARLAITSVADVGCCQTHTQQHRVSLGENRSIKKRERGEGKKKTAPSSACSGFVAVSPLKFFFLFN